MAYMWFKTQLSANNQIIDVSMNINPLKGADNKTDGLIISFRNISELIQLQNELIGKSSFQNIIAKSKKMNAVLTYFKDFAESDSLGVAS